MVTIASFLLEAYPGAWAASFRCPSIAPFPAAELVQVFAQSSAGNTDRVVQSRHAAILAKELKARGRVAELVSFPGEGHSIRKPRNVVETYRETVRFLDRHLN